MKKLRILPLLLVLSFQLPAAQAQVDAGRLIKSKSFSFVPQTMSPMSGGTRQVSPEFSVKLSGDSLIVYLPYVGKAHAPVLPGEEGMDFISTAFEYRSRKRKKNWELTIKPKDTREVRQLNFTVYDNGHARLFISSNTKQSISYDGYLTEAGGGN